MTRPAPPASAPAQPPMPSVTPRWVWALLILLAAALFAVAAGLLDRADGESIPHAIFVGGGAFGATVLVLLTLARFLRGDHG